MEIKIITSNYFNDVVKHLRNSFFADEPLNRSMRLCKMGEGNKDLEEHCAATLRDNLSIMALYNNEIAGVILNGILHPGDTLRAKTELQFSKDENFKTIFNLLYNENLKHNFFDNFNVDKLFDIRILSVDSKFRGQGIAKKLIDSAEELAKKYCFRIMKADATGLFSQKILKSHGFVPISEIYYDKYISKNGLPILLVEPPHVKLEILYKQICVSNNVVS